MKSRRLLVKKIAKNVSVENQDLSDDFGLNAIAESEMQRVKRKVSPDLYDMLEQQLLGFHGDCRLKWLRISQNSPKIMWLLLRDAPVPTSYSIYVTLGLPPSRVS